MEDCRERLHRRQALKGRGGDGPLHEQWCQSGLWSCLPGPTPGHGTHRQGPTQGGGGPQLGCLTPALPVRPP